MKLPDLLEFKKYSFSTKIFSLFTVLLLIAYAFFSLTFIHYQSKALKRDLIHQGELLTGLLARSAKLGVFTENNKLLTGPVKNIIKHKEALHVLVFTAEGRQLISQKKTPGTQSAMSIDRIKEMDSEAFNSVKETGSIHHSASNDKFIFWAPIYSGTAYSGEDLITLSVVYNSNPSDGTARPARDHKSIIGFAKTVFTTTALNNEIRKVVRKSIIIPVFFLMPVWIIVFLFVKRITRPLNVLTDSVTALGTGGPVTKVPVDTDDEIGKLAGAFNGMLDSLEAKETEKKKIEEQLRQSQKIEAVGTLAGGVAHDFNNILNIIIGYAGLIKKKVSLKKNEKIYIERLIATAERASAITQSLLSFSRQKTVNLSPEKINGIISGMENVIKRFIGENIELNIMLSENDPAVLTDPGLIEQILINLISNSKHAMSGGGKLTIRTESITIEKALNVTSGIVEPGTYAVIIIEDTDTGMDTMTKEKIFDPFFTTKEVGKGTGLGLSMMYGIVQQHNGSIDVSSSPEKGTSFSIYLRTTDLPVVSAEEAGSTEPESGTETILLAEDNDELRSLTEEILKEYGYKIITASDGEDALSKFNEHRNRIDLLLLNMIMPKKNGKEVFEAARKLRPDVKTLFISAYTAENISGDDASPGMSEQHFLQKPFQPARLLRTVRDIIDDRSY